MAAPNPSILWYFLLRSILIVPELARFDSGVFSVFYFSAAGRWFHPNTAISSTNKTYLHDINVILLKVALNTHYPPYYTD
jgi:hypothetical protein